MKQIVKRVLVGVTVGAFWAVALRYMPSEGLFLVLLACSTITPGDNLSTNLATMTTYQWIGLPQSLDMDSPLTTLNSSHLADAKTPSGRNAAPSAARPIINAIEGSSSQCRVLVVATNNNLFSSFSS